MKKIIRAISVMVLMLASVSVSAGGPGDLYLFNHLGIGAHVGTTGFGFEAATPITKWVTLRGGVTIMPGIKFNTDIDGTYEGTHEGQHIEQDFTMDVKGSLSRVQGSVIFNIYPLTHLTSFYIAAGGYFGGSKIVGVTGHSDELMNLANGDSYLELGDYKLPVDKNGNVDGALKVNAFRPYLGIGFGRPLPKGRLNFGVELGVQFHGKMKLYNRDTELEKVPSLDNDDDWQKWMDKLTVYPVLKFTLSGRIF